jgi:hypothetical protein
MKGCLFADHPLDCRGDNYSDSGGSIARHNSFVAEVNVPNPVIGQSEDLSFASIVMGAKAVN